MGDAQSQAVTVAKVPAVPGHSEGAECLLTGIHRHSAGPTTKDNVTRKRRRGEDQQDQVDREIAKTLAGPARQVAEAVHLRVGADVGASTGPRSCVPDVVLDSEVGRVYILPDGTITRGES
jgi:hypothetical protein